MELIKSYFLTEYTLLGVIKYWHRVKKTVYMHMLMHTHMHTQV
jgi:hypothetical protein